MFFFVTSHRWFGNIEGRSSSLVEFGSTSIKALGEGKILARSVVGRSLLGGISDRRTIVGSSSRRLVATVFNSFQTGRSSQIVLIFHILFSILEGLACIQSGGSVINASVQIRLSESTGWRAHTRGVSYVRRGGFNRGDQFNELRVADDITVADSSEESK